jgi:hypothetical protein
MIKGILLAITFTLLLKNLNSNNRCLINNKQNKKYKKRKFLFFFVSFFYLTSTFVIFSSTFVGVFFAASITNTPLFIFASIFEGIISSGIAILL